MTDPLTQALLPAGLMFIMFVLGIGLTPADFRGVFASPRAFLVGIACHFVILPLVAFLLVTAWGFTGSLAVGFMILAACPTGTTSNILTYFARGDVALALSFTAFAGLVSIVTVPFIVGAAIGHFAGAERAVNVPAGPMMVQIFLVMGLPVMAGMGLRHRAPGFAARWQAALGKASLVVFLGVVTIAIARNWALFRDYTAVILPLAFTLMAVMLAISYSLSRAVQVSVRQAVTVAIESSIQNVTLAIVIATSLLKDDLASVPGAIYGVMMYFVMVAFVFVARRIITRG